MSEFGRDPSWVWIKTQNSFTHTNDLSLEFFELSHAQSDWKRTLERRDFRGDGREWCFHVGLVQYNKPEFLVSAVFEKSYQKLWMQSPTSWLQKLSSWYVETLPILVFWAPASAGMSNLVCKGPKRSETASPNCQIVWVRQSKGFSNRSVLASLLLLFLPHL